MRRLTLLCCVAAMLAGAVMTTEAQSAFWILVNGALRTTRAITTGNITTNGTISATSTITGNNLQAGVNGNIGWVSSSQMAAPSDGVIALFNNAQTDFSRLQFGGTTSSFPSLKRNASGLICRLADDSGNCRMTMESIVMNAGILIHGTAPTVTSAGTTPSVTGNNATATFRVNVGTGGTATTIVMAMPAAVTGWNCEVENLTANAANRVGQRVVPQSSTTTSVTVQNQTIATGAALAFTASDIVQFVCFAF